MAGKKPAHTSQPGTALSPEAEPKRGSSRVRSVRFRVLATLLMFMAAGLVAAGSISYTVQFRVLEERVDTELQQEIEELRTSTQNAMDEAAANGESAQTLDEVLRLAVTSVVPSDYESVLAIIDGQPEYRPAEQRFELATPEVLEQISALRKTDQTILVTLNIQDQATRVVIAPVTVAGDPAEGTFVVVNDIAAQKSEIWRSAMTFAAVSLLTLLAALIVGYRVTGRLLRPIGQLRQATERITANDLDLRVNPGETDDDVAALATNFNRMLERIDHGVTEQKRFMSDVSHELKTPLTIVRGTLETTDLQDPEDVREAHEIALEELDRMNRLVGDLSILAAVTRPDFIHLSPVELKKLTTKVASRFEHLGPRDWQVECGANIIFAADENRLIQALLQLGANAVRYSSPGSRICLTSGIKTTLTGEQRVFFAVTDDGIGIAPADHGRIFERFARAEVPAGARAQGADAGSGLGLSIVQAIARGHGGEVQVQSRLGHGSTFTISIPI